MILRKIPESLFRQLVVGGNRVAVVSSLGVLWRISVRIGFIGYGWRNGRLVVKLFSQIHNVNNPPISRAYCDVHDSLGSIEYGEA
jgi:hypothetical protein